MSKRRFEMYHYRQALVRMRLGDSDRDLARSRLMGRKKAAQLREIAMHTRQPLRCAKPAFGAGHPEQGSRPTGRPIGVRYLGHDLHRRRAFLPRYPNPVDALRER